MLLWLIADDEEELEESQREKALLDAEELKEDDLSLDQDKVELDLDDAPFLDDEDDEEEEEEDFDVEDTGEDSEKSGSLKDKLKDKRVLGALIGGLVILLGIIVVVLLYPGDGEEDEEELAPAVAEEQQPPEPDLPPPPAEHLVAFKPFWVEHINEDGMVRLLFFKFSALTENEKLAWEMTHKRLVLRDAIFYYLKNKDLRFLSDKTKAQQLKSDMLSVINQYLNVDQVQELLIEEYLVK